MRSRVIPPVMVAYGSPRLLSVAPPVVRHRRALSACEFQFLGEMFFPCKNFSHKLFVVEE